MAFWKIFTFTLTTVLLAEAKWHHPQKRAIFSNICDPAYNSTVKVICLCIKDHREPTVVRSADCHLKDDLSSDNEDWNGFNSIKNIHKLTFAHSMGKTLKYIPTQALTHTNALLKVDIKHANIEVVQKFAFANLSFLEDIILRRDKTKVLEVHAFAHLRDLTTISLDSNEIIEINRDVFIDLPSLQKLFLTSNKITTIHDRAFIHLINLKELEIDRNSLFSLNSETFSGLKKLQKLDISSNALEVIGDNTFLPLVNLIYLNLDGNKIQMLDGNAFKGLHNLRTMNLARNKLTAIDNAKVFEGLEELHLLSLKGNHLRELKLEVIAPILTNFYGPTSALDVEDNSFPCDCRLEWLVSLMNKTQNNRLKLDLENLKCYPDPKLKEAWMKMDDKDSEKNGVQIFDEEEPQNTEYEYYDDSQLNGKLFYTDLRVLMNCTKSNSRAVPTSTLTTTSVLLNGNPTKELFSPTTTTVKPTTPYKTSPIHNHGLLDLTLIDTTPNVIDVKFKAEENSILSTTSRVVTVANTIETHQPYDHMASDEAKSERNVKAHRSIQDKIEETPKHNANNANRNMDIAASLLVLILCLRLLN